MKAIKMRIQKFSRPAAILLATVVAIITSIVVANATQTITTPNAAFISYSIAPSGNSAVITPATSKSVSVMGCCTTTGNQSVAQASLQHIPGGGMAWVGLSSEGAISQGNTATMGTIIVRLDAAGFVRIEVASADTIHVTNHTSLTQTGNVTLIW